MGKSNKRLWILLSAALLLGGAYWYDTKYGFSTIFQSNGLAGNVAENMPDFSGGIPAVVDTLPALYRKKAELENFKARQEEIDKQYFTLASAYADQIASLTGLITEPGGDDKQFVANILQTKLDDVGTLEDIKINVAESEALSPGGGRKALADIMFTTHSSQDAAKTVLDLGDGKNGMIWRSLSLATDRNRRGISVTGRLAVFLAEAAE